MPEAPEMQVVSEYLGKRLPGRRVKAAKALKPVARSLAGDFETDIMGRDAESVSRRGKFLIIQLSGERRVVVNPKLTGGLQYVPATTRVLKSACVRIQLDGGDDLRYVDAKMMGQFYYVPDDQTDDVPGIAEQGPDVLDDFAFEEFSERLSGFHGEIKGILTRGRVIAGIGNAYADEILFDAKVYPFKRRKALSEDERRRIYDSARRVSLDAIEKVRERLTGNQLLSHKSRDFMRVHLRGGEPCPDCGRAITELRANRRVTSYCRGCQPGMLLRN